MTDPTLKLHAPMAPKPREFSPAARNPKLAGIRDAAAMLGLSRATMDRRLADPKSTVPRPFVIGGKRLWLRRDLEEYLLASALLSRTRSSSDHG